MRPQYVGFEPNLKTKGMVIEFRYLKAEDNLRSTKKDLEKEMFTFIIYLTGVSTFY